MMVSKNIVLREPISSLSDEMSSETITYPELQHCFDEILTSIWIPKKI